MVQIYNPKNFFFYKEKSIFFSYGRLGSYKISIPCVNDIIFYILSNILFFKKKKLLNMLPSFFFKSLSRFLLFLGISATAINNGYQLKFGPKGKRTRIHYSSFLFFFKLGYSTRISFLLPLDIFSNTKDKKEKFFNLRSLNYNSLSNTVFQISSFRSIDPYNFGGIMLRDGFFKYKKWSSKLS
jgi:hypothetical protein